MVDWRSNANIEQGTPNIEHRSEMQKCQYRNTNTGIPMQNTNIEIPMHRLNDQLHLLWTVFMPFKQIWKKCLGLSWESFYFVNT
jgi:hypothetical protein